jgi:FAD/FMN-containing dehydrogenase
MNNTQLDSLIKDLKGQAITPGDELYEHASATFLHKGSPALVLRPATGEDIAAAIRYAGDNSIPLSVRSGGHSFAGFSTNTGGVVIDLSSQKHIQLIDPVERIVRIGAGATWGEVAQVLREHQLAISSGDTKSVGVGGLTLGGGIGWMVRKYGLAIDSLLAAQVVTASGEVLRANAAENKDLFWAIRGGGGNFGVVTSFEFVAQPVSKVTFGTIVYGTENMPDVIRGWRDIMRTATEELTTTLFIMPPFGESPASVMIICCYAGTGPTAVQALGPLLELGTVLQEDLKEVDYADVLEEGQQPPDFLRIIGKNVFVESFSEELIQALGQACGREGSPAVSIRALGGALARVAPTETAFAYRQSEALITGGTFVPAGASESEISRALKPWQSIAAYGSGAYTNFQGTATDLDVAAIYPPVTYARLAAVKARYDPDNIFNQNHNIRPALEMAGVESTAGGEERREEST